MLHKIISTIGLGILGVDPITVVYVLAMGLRNEKKSKITLFFLSFAGFSIFIGAGSAAIFEATAADFLKNIIPGDNSPFWAGLEFAISVIILVWVFGKLATNKDKKDKKERKPVIGNGFKYITTGLVFALTSFTDPTFYAVILMGGETGNFFLAAILLAIWFLVSQFMAVIVYIANQLNFLNKLVNFIDKINLKNLKPIIYIFYALLILVAMALLADTGFYLFKGQYIF